MIIAAFGIRVVGSVSIVPDSAEPPYLLGIYKFDEVMGSFAQHDGTEVVLARTAGLGLLSPTEEDARLFALQHPDQGKTVVFLHDSKPETGGVLPRVTAVVGSPAGNSLLQLMRENYWTPNVGFAFRDNVQAATAEALLSA